MEQVGTRYSSGAPEEVWNGVVLKKKKKERRTEKNRSWLEKISWMMILLHLHNFFVYVEKGDDNILIFNVLIKVKKNMGNSIMGKRSFRRSVNYFWNSSQF